MFKLNLKLIVVLIISVLFITSCGAAGTTIIETKIVTEVRPTFFGDSWQFDNSGSEMGVTINVAFEPPIDKLQLSKLTLGYTVDGKHQVSVCKGQEGTDWGFWIIDETSVAAEPTKQSKFLFFIPKSISEVALYYDGVKLASAIKIGQ